MLSASEASLQFALEDRTPFYGWRASYGSNPNGRFTELGEGGGYVEPDPSASRPPAVEQIEFPAPPAGDWIVSVSIYFFWGDASYNWRVRVP